VRRQAHVASIKSGRDKSSLPELNKKEIERFKLFLETLEKSPKKGTCSLAFLGISSSCATTVLDKISQNL
jgi:hypothetical protein